jgi:hypothetical protein
MTLPETRTIQLVHVLPGRARLRLSWLRGDEGAATALADGLVKLPGVTQVDVRLHTGSVLSRYDPGRVHIDRIVEEIGRLTGVAQVVLPGQPLPPPPRRRLGKSALAHEVSAFFRGLNADVLRATDGSLDLGTAVTTTFVIAGALGVTLQHELSAPPWFNLAWWGVRTFISFEQEEPDEPAREDGGRAA